MKKFNVLSIVLLTGILSGCFTAREATVHAKKTSTFPVRLTSLSDTTGRNNTVNGYLNAISTRAMRDFEHRYAIAAHVKWYVIKDGYMAKFRQDSIQWRVDYDRAGYWTYTMRTFKENKLPKQVRHQVKSAYYDDAIKLVHEFILPEKLVYLIYLQRGGKYTTLRVSEGEMEEIFNEKK